MIIGTAISPGVIRNPLAVADPVEEVLAQITSDGEGSGIYYYDTHVCDMFQDTSGITPANAAGHDLLRIDEYFGKENFTQGTGPPVEPVLVSETTGLEVHHQSDYLSLTIGTPFDLGIDGTSTGVELLFCMRDNEANGAAGQKAFFNGYDGANTNNRFLWRRDNANDYRAYSLTGTPANVYAQDTSLDSGNVHVYRIRYKENTPTRGVALWEDGVLVNNNSSGNSGTFELSQMFLGVRQGLTEYALDFSWSAFALIRREIVSQTNIDALETALITRV